MTVAVDNLIVESLLTMNVVGYSYSTTVTSAAGSLELTSISDSFQYFTGTAIGYSITLPVATTLQAGWHFILVNTTNQTITIKDGSGTALFTLSQNSVGYIYLQLNTTAAGSWTYYQVLATSTASGIINYNLTSTTPFATSATTDTLITGFVLTPQAGTYAIWYNASVLHTTTPISHWWSIYKAGVQIADSERQQDTAHSNQVMVDTTMTVSQFNGSQTADVRVRRGTSGTLTVNARSLVLIRLGA